MNLCDSGFDDSECPCLKEMRRTLPEMVEQYNCAIYGRLATEEHCAFVTTIGLQGKLGYELILTGTGNPREVAPVLNQVARGLLFEGRTLRLGELTTEWSDDGTHCAFFACTAEVNSTYGREAALYAEQPVQLVQMVVPNANLHMPWTAAYKQDFAEYTAEYPDADDQVLLFPVPEHLQCGCGALH